MSAIAINELNVAYGSPISTGNRVWLRIEASNQQVADIFRFLVEVGVAFSYDQYINGEHEITVNEDDKRALELAIEEAQ